MTYDVSKDTNNQSAVCLSKGSNFKTSIDRSCVSVLTSDTRSSYLISIWLIGARVCQKEDEYDFDFLAGCWWNIHAFDLEFTEQCASAPTLIFCMMSSIKDVCPYARNLLNLLKSSGIVESISESDISFLSSSVIWSCISIRPLPHSVFLLLHLSVLLRRCTRLRAFKDKLLAGILSL